MSRDVHVVGIDPSLTDTGVAELVLRPDDSWDVYRWHFPSKGTRRDSLDARGARLGRISANVMSWSADADLVVIEGPAYASTVGSILDRYGLWWRIVNRLLLADKPVAVCPPTVLKKFVTGNGAAKKSAVIAEVNAMWSPDVPITNDNVADALGLATLGAVALQLPMPIGFDTATNLPAMLTGVEWPESFEELVNDVA